MSLEEKYETGVVWQDFQHKQLIELFGKVKEAKREEKDQNLYRYTVAFLAMYVTHHFRLEEQYMNKYQYPDKQVHIQEHKEFIDELKKFRAENQNYSQEASEALLTNMGEWILSHIHGDDKVLGEFILNIEKKLTLKK